MRASAVISVGVFIAIMALPAMAAGNCADANDQATMNACADKALKISDAELNKLYKQIEGRLKDDTDTTRLLVSAQRAWIGYRDAECSFATSGAAGGSIYPLVAAQCRDGITQKRIADFKDFLSCEEGDLSCPVPAAD